MTAPTAAWDAVRTTPEGTALADAYLTLRQEFHMLLLAGRHAVQDAAGPSVQAFRERMDRVSQLLDEPYGAAWANEYWRMRLAVLRAEKTLQEGLDVLAKPPAPAALLPVSDWETIRAVPGGAALADAYLTQRDALSRLMATVQLLARGQGGMTLDYVGQEVDRLLPLLDEPYGRAWTEAYWQTSPRRTQSERVLQEALEALMEVQP